MRNESGSAGILLLQETLTKAREICRKARRHGHPLKGNGFYASKFSDLHADATIALSRIRGDLAHSEGAPAVMADVETMVKTFFDPNGRAGDRLEPFQQLQFLLKTRIEPLLQHSHHQASDEFFPREIVAGTRGYIETVAEQACGSYDLSWYDAAAVMARRLLETLIIETYEAHRLDSKIKKADGTFHHLSGLIGILASETQFNVGRNTKTALPRLKDLGDQSAHNRRYLAKKKDLDDIRRDFRVALEELVHLSKLKK
jgi:hypothetical protein